MVNGDAGLSRINRLTKDLTAGVVVFLVALPLCLGIAVASNADPFSGIVSGIVGGIVVGILSGSHTSVSGPAAGLTAIVATQISTLGSFEAFLAAVMVAGAIQLGLGFAKAGVISAFVPSSVIKGLLSAIGLILIINQLPKLLGHQDNVVVLDEIVSGQANHVADHENVLLKLFDLLEGTFIAGPMILGICSTFFLLAWDRIKILKKSIIPAPLVVVAVGILVTWLLERFAPTIAIPKNMLVSVPVLESWFDSTSLVRLPDFRAFLSPAVYLAGFTIAIVASLETLLNLEAVDKIDPKQRYSPPNKELFAQGVGNVLAGLIGGLPMTSVIVRSSVNINAGGQTRLSAIVHGFLLFGFVICLPQLLNLIPYASLAAILVVTGFKLLSWKMIRELWEAGRYQFAPFFITVCAIVMTDLLIGILVGLGCSLAFILYSNYRRPIRRIVEKRTGGELLRIELANQVSFLNRAALESVLRKIPRGGRVLIDASNSDYIDPDILALVRDFRNKVAPARGVQVSLSGFQSQYAMQDEIHHVDYTTKEQQESMKPADVLQVLLDGNERFRSGQSIVREPRRQLKSTSHATYPMAVILSCIDPRTPTELIFDLGIGDAMNICLAGNAMIGPRVLASIEYSCNIAGAKLVVVLGHTRSQVIRSSINYLLNPGSSRTEEYGEFFGSVAEEIRPAMERVSNRLKRAIDTDDTECIDAVATEHVILSVQRIQELSQAIRELIQSGKVALVGLMYDVETGAIAVVNTTVPDRKASADSSQSSTQA